MLFDPEKVPGVGKLVLIDIDQDKRIRREFDKLFEDVEGLSRIFCAVCAELSDAYRIWDIYGLPYTSDIIRLPGIEREEPVELLALWTEVLTIRTVRLTDKSKSHEPVSVVQFLELDLEPDLKTKVEELIKITEDKTKPLRRTRDKFIGHKDFDVVDRKINIHEPGYTIHDIADILESIANILRCIYIYYSGKNDRHLTGWLKVRETTKY
ncbi:hypothetical protein F4X10_11345 [Candidatus Poribacteria bacterium]|nr:hypothetical protein [Candidatus Poribacteria bacterium]